MADVVITLPEESLIGVRLPPKQLEEELRRRLAAALFSDGIISGASACRMSGMTKTEFQAMLGDHGVIQPHEAEDLDDEMTNLEKWKTS